MQACESAPAPAATSAAVGHFQALGDEGVSEGVDASSRALPANIPSLGPHESVGAEGSGNLEGGRSSRNLPSGEIAPLAAPTMLQEPAPGPHAGWLGSAGPPAAFGPAVTSAGGRGGDMVQPGTTLVQQSSSVSAAHSSAGSGRPAAGAAAAAATRQHSARARRGSGVCDGFTSRVPDATPTSAERRAEKARQEALSFRCPVQDCGAQISTGRTGAFLDTTTLPLASAARHLARHQRQQHAGAGAHFEAALGVGTCPKLGANFLLCDTCGDLYGCSTIKAGTCVSCSRGAKAGAAAAEAPGGRGRPQQRRAAEELRRATAERVSAAAAAQQQQRSVGGSWRSSDAPPLTSRTPRQRSVQPLWHSSCWHSR